jgi:hypothetical protein
MFAPKVYEGFMLGYDLNSCAYRVFNKDSSCVETMCDAVFDETIGSQVEQYNLDDVDDEEAPCDALRTMSISDVRAQEANEDQPYSNEVAPSIEEGEQDEDDDQDHEMGNDQGGDQKDEDGDDKKSQGHHHSLIQELGKSFNMTI